MKFVITGASGFIGQRLLHRHTTKHFDMHALGRKRPPGPDGMQFTKWDAAGSPVPAEAVEGAVAVIHLAGEPVGQRWTDETKRRIRDSRVLGTRAVVEAIARCRQRPRVLVSASAVGYYGDRDEETLTESSGRGPGYLADVCVEWEQEAFAAEQLGVRVVTLRTGVVLGAGGGALKQMIPPFKLGVGGPTGSGKQWISWIHVDDLVEAIVFSLENQQMSGPVNTTAPNPVRNEEFAKALGHVLHRPSLVHTPIFALELMLGQGAEILLWSQRVIPQSLQNAGFTFGFPEIDSALKDAITHG